MNILFVCTENLVRSPMAASLFNEFLGPGSPHQAYAAGTASHAPRRLTTRDLAWADLVAVMEHRHRATIQAYWANHLAKVIVLEVSDHFMSGDASLREVLEPKVRALLQHCNGHASAWVAPSAARPR